MSDDNKKDFDNESISEKLTQLASMHRKQYRSTIKRIKRIDANVDLIRAQQQQTDTEVELLKDRSFLRDKKVSELVSINRDRENTSNNKDVQLWKFIGNSESLFTGLKESIDDTRDGVNKLHDVVVTKDDCKTNREACHKPLRSKKLWYDFIPITVSAITLLALILGGMKWFVTGPGAIDSATVNDLKAIVKERDKTIKESKRKAMLVNSTNANKVYEYKHIDKKSCINTDDKDCDKQSE